MPTHYDGTPREVRALDAFIKLSRALESVNGRLNQDLAREGVTPAQLAVLEALHHLGPMSAGELAGKLLRSAPNMTVVLGNLERSGWISRTRRRSDRRVVNVSLTAAGRRRIRKVFPGHARRVAELMAALTPAEQEQLGGLCRKLGRAAAAVDEAGEAMRPADRRAPG